MPDPKANRPSSPHFQAGAVYDPSAGGAGSLVRSWARHWRADPARVCVLTGEGEALSYGALEAGSRRIAGRLHAAGLRSGDRILLSAASSPELVRAYVACLRLGLVVVPTNTAYREAEIAHVVGDARPRAALLDDAQRGRWVHARDPEVLLMSPRADLADRRDPGEPADAPAPPLDCSRPEDPALIGYTSGTTGRPKGAVLSHANLLASAEALRLAWRWSADDRLALCLPLFHMHGLGVGLHGSLHAGASLVLLPRFEAEAVFDAIEVQGATLFFGVPTLYHRLVEAPRARALAKLRLCVSGSAPLPAGLHRRFEAVTGQRILERYGMTETVMLVSNPYAGERRPGSVGLPLPGVELRQAGEPGEIQVRGPNVFSGYWERPEANAAAFTEDGWFCTGDLGVRDEAGYLCITGRAKELVISGGYNVYPREVEDALGEHPEIEEAAVSGTPSEEWGETVTAWLVCSRDIEVEELRQFLAERLAPFKHPRIVHRVAVLPRNAIGKVQRHLLGAHPDYRDAD